MTQYICLSQSEHNKNYATDEEDKERFELFKSSVARILEHNEKFAKGEVTFTMGLNKFADMKPEEYKCCGSLKQ